MVELVGGLSGSRAEREGRDQSQLSPLSLSVWIISTNTPLHCTGNRCWCCHASGQGLTNILTAVSVSSQGRLWILPCVSDYMCPLLCWWRGEPSNPLYVSWMSSYETLPSHCRHLTFSPLHQPLTDSLQTSQDNLDLHYYLLFTIITTRALL